MRFARRFMIAALVLSACAIVQTLVVAQGLVPMKCPELTGTYSLENVHVRGKTATVTFSFILENIGDTVAEIDKISLNNLANTDFSYASFGRARIAAHDEIVRTKVIRVPLREYQRWERGNAPRLFLRLPGHFIQDPCRRGCVDLARKIADRPG